MRPCAVGATLLCLPHSVTSPESKSIISMIRNVGKQPKCDIIFNLISFAIENEKQNWFRLFRIRLSPQSYCPESAFCL